MYQKTDSNVVYRQKITKILYHGISTITSTSSCGYIYNSFAFHPYHVCSGNKNRSAPALNIDGSSNIKIKILKPVSLQPYLRNRFIISSTRSYTFNSLCSLYVILFCLLIFQNITIMRLNACYSFLNRTGLPMFVIPSISLSVLMIKNHRLILVVSLFENHPTMTCVS